MLLKLCKVFDPDTFFTCHKKKIPSNYQSLKSFIKKFVHPKDSTSETKKTIDNYHCYYIC